LSRDGGRVFAEDGFLSVIALTESHAAPAPKIDGWIENHGSSLSVGLAHEDSLTVFRASGGYKRVK
jgi:hypothetical protein